jgi:hypothetical protein
MGGFEYAKLLESMQRFGFTDPLTVRSRSGKLQLIDGEHRLRAARDLGLSSVPYFDVGEISDDEAKALGIVLNELKGRHDPRVLGDLLKDLLERSSPEEMLVGMPFTTEALEGLIGNFDWSTFEQPKTEEGTPLISSRKGSSWVERTFRLPHEVNEVLTSALDKAREGDEIEDWQALERVAADYLGGN